MLSFLPTFALLQAAATAGQPGAAARTFAEQVRPFVDAYCLGCHGRDKIKGNLDLRGFETLSSVTADLPQWATIAEQLEQEDMPPDDAKQPSAQERQRMVAWIKDLRAAEAKRNAGDPGVVLARRLNSNEYNYTIRDLTGVDIRPAKEFPVDPANEVGFDNTGESLAMSPGLLAKHYDAARKTADHLVLTPTGFHFAPYPVTSDTDRDKYCVNRIVEFYRQQPTDLADYFFAAWKHKHRAAASVSLSSVARNEGVSARYLSLVWKTLNQPETLGPIAALQAMWNDLPAPGPDAAAKVRASCDDMRDWVRRLREKTKVQVPNLRLKGANSGAQALVLWKDRQMAANRRRYGGGALKLQPDDLPAHPLAAARLAVPTQAKAQAQYEAAFVRFARVFPDAFFVSERARVFLENTDEDKDNVGRLLSAGFHNQMGYFRDDGPLYDLVLSKAEQRKLDGLWQELDFVTAAPLRQHASLIWFERSESSYLRDPEFDFARSEDKEVVSPEKFQRFANAYVAKAKRTTDDATTLAAVKEHFELTNRNIRWVQTARRDAEPIQVRALLAFAEQAYRRPLSVNQRAELLGFYRQLRSRDGRAHEDAIRDAVVSVLMSPRFLYRMDPSQPAHAVRPLDDLSLASRLSYFLWSSMPDQALLDAAAQGKLRQPAVLRAHTRRMLKHERMRDFSREFVGNWLDIRRFEEHNAVDRGHFTTFTNNLRQAMFEEPLRFVEDVIHNDRSVLDLLFGQHTFVNADLAAHYGMPVAEAKADAWVRVPDASRFGRGGILPMAVFLTKNAPGLRTSPVKRGHFVVSRVLGERIPAPPPDVPELPSDESKLGAMTLRESLAQHREDKNCSGCHARFDSFGLVFENYGPVGERREKDLGGRPVDVSATFPGGASAEGLEGLRQYIRAHRQDDFIDNVCRKLLAYALGRSLMASDDLTVAQMKQVLQSREYRISALFEHIVTSSQFLNKRG